jgi:hypothetical protein
LNLFVKNQTCVLVIVADGFEETQTVMTLSLLRQAGLCVKSVGLTSGLIGGAHGVRLMPDLTFTELDRLTTSIRLVFLPSGRQSLTRLEADPRVHRLLRRVVAQQGQIVTGPEGLRVSRAAALWVSASGEDVDDDQRTPVLLRDPNQPPEVFTRELIQRLKRSDWI